MNVGRSVAAGLQPCGSCTSSSVQEGRRHGDIRQPTLQKRVEPAYPAEAKAAGAKGPVYVEAIIGRDPRATVFIDDRSISRRHARIVVSDDGATLEDLGSKNGTFLQSEKVESVVPLSDGDQLKVGDVLLKIRIFPVPESTATGAAV